MAAPTGGTRLARRHRLPGPATPCRRSSTTPPSRPPGSTGSTSPSRSPRAGRPRPSPACGPSASAGLSVTMPHKDAVAAACDRLSPDAAALGAVNCVVPDGDALVGHNTDGAGFVGALAADGIDLVGHGVRRARRRGSGAGRGPGAGRAAGAAEVAVVNRTADRAEQAVALLGGPGRVVEPRRRRRRRGGRRPGRERHLRRHGRPVAGRPARRSRPPSTRARSWPTSSTDPSRHRSCARLVRGAPPASNGVPMLVHQAAVAFELWTGVTAPVAAMTASVAHLLG